MSIDWKVTESRYWASIKPTLPKLDLDNIAGIPEYYSGRNLFITGVTGFLGKVLLEKLLRSCPDIGTIYVLLRNKRGVAPSDRVQKFTDLPIYDRLKKEQPNALSKVVVMLGDVMSLNLGLGEQDIELINKNVSIIFHVAASVRFNDPLQKSILMNTRSAREIVKIAKNMDQLKVLVHVSTTYCNIDKPVIGEIVYPARADYRQMIEMAETMDSDTIRTLENKILNGFPNTYTFTKSLAENIMQDAQEDLNIVIYRPTIVVAAMAEPFPGWIDSMNGPLGIFVGVGTGFLHTLYIKTKVSADWVAVDQTVNGMIAASWYKSNSTHNKDKCLVLNSGNGNVRPFTYDVLFNVRDKYAKLYPFQMMLWYPYVISTSNKIFYYIMYLLLHILPALFADILLKLAGKKFSLTKLYRKAFTANMALSTFMCNDWVFLTTNYYSLISVMGLKDQKKFPIAHNVDMNEYMESCMNGIQRYLLHEPPQTEQRLREKLSKYYKFRIVHYVVTTLIVLGVLYLASLIFNN